MMSRPASQSACTSAVKRRRTLSLCADHVESILPPPQSAPYPTRPLKRARVRAPALPSDASRVLPPRDLSQARHASALCPTSRHCDRPQRHHSSAHALSNSIQSSSRPHRNMISSSNRPPPQTAPHAPPRKPHPPYSLPCTDDADGHLIYNLGDGLHPSSQFPNGRYKILSDLGEGTFGKVVECWDRRLCQRVAVKIIRSVTKYRQAARLEIDVLMHLKMHDPLQLYHCVKFYSWFDYRLHMCVVFEKLGPSLYEHLRRNRFRPFPLQQVRAFAFQLLESVNFVHNLTLIHTDLKPENILLADSKRPDAIKLIDFGSATFESQHHSAVISTRHYRAPEVILGLGWTYPCDLWSIGCILVELYTGKALFQTHEDLEHLAMMIEVLGPIPESMINRAVCSSQKYFICHKGGHQALNWPAGASSIESVRSVKKVQALHEIIGGPDAHAAFFDLVRRLLAFEPAMRCTPAEALQHPFFRDAVCHSRTSMFSAGAIAQPLRPGNSTLRPRRKRILRKKRISQNEVTSCAFPTPTNGSAPGNNLKFEDDGNAGNNE